jgi:hypothetical protein
MGERGHIGIVHHNNATPIYFYTHWDGHYVPTLLAEGLKRAMEAGRLTDESYATRIVFDTLTGCTGSTTSYGILIGEPQSDNEYAIPTVMWEQGDGEPFVVYEDSRYSARDFITEFLPSSEQPIEQEQAV